MLPALVGASVPVYRAPRPAPTVRPDSRGHGLDATRPVGIALRVAAAIEEHARRARGRAAREVKR